MIAEQLPAGAFCEASLQAVAGGCEFFPAFSVLQTALSEWWNVHESRHERIAGSYSGLPDWLYESIMSQCGARPGPNLAAWIEDRAR